MSGRIAVGAAEMSAVAPSARRHAWPSDGPGGVLVGQSGSAHARAESANRAMHPTVKRAAAVGRAVIALSRLPRRHKIRTLADLTPPNFSSVRCGIYQIYEKPPDLTQKRPGWNDHTCF